MQRNKRARSGPAPETGETSRPAANAQETADDAPTSGSSECYDSEEQRWREHGDEAQDPAPEAGKTTSQAADAQEHTDDQVAINDQSRNDGSDTSRQESGGSQDSESSTDRLESDGSCDGMSLMTTGRRPLTRGCA